MDVVKFIMIFCVILSGKLSLNEKEKKKMLTAFLKTPS